MTVSDGDNKLATGGSWLSAWFITLAMASVAVFLLPASFNVADDVGAQMILAGLDGFCGGLAGVHVEAYFYPGLDHEIFNERGKGKVLGHLVGWLDGRGFDS